MLSEKIAREIHTLIDHGYSFRRVAELVGVSRGSVAAIARSRRGTAGEDILPDESDLVLQPPERCGECGAWVRLPCVACRTRLYLEMGGKRFFDPQRELAGGPLRLASAAAHARRASSRRPREPRQVA